MVQMAKTVKAEAKSESRVQVTINPPKIETAKFRIVGTAPYVQARFSAKAMQSMKKHYEKRRDLQLAMF